MGLEGATNKELLRVIDLKVEGCPDSGCRTCKANEDLLHELAKRLGVPDYMTFKQERARRILADGQRLSPKRSEKEVKKIRDECLETLKENGAKYEEITCDHCSDKDSCEWSYDPYNTDGDCLANK